MFYLFNAFLLPVSSLVAFGKAFLYNFTDLNFFVINILCFRQYQPVRINVNRIRQEQLINFLARTVLCQV